MTDCVLRIFLTSALLFQVSDLSRVAYVLFDLAPDCPVVGQTQRSADHCCDAQPDDPPAVASACVGDESDRPTPPVQESPRERSEKCPTCQMLATVHTFAALELPAPVLIARETGLEQAPADDLPHLSLLISTHCRAPPRLLPAV